MSSILLRTILIAAQILTGFCGNSTLCLRSDGTVCCVHDRGNECSCCEHDHETPSGSYAYAHARAGHADAVCLIARNQEHDDHEEDQDSPASEDGSAPNGSRVLDSSVPAELPMNSNAPCGCRHVPFAAGTAPASEKSSAVTSSVRRYGRPSISLAHADLGMHLSRIVPGSIWLRVFRCQSVGLTIVPSTVIRC